MGRRKLQLVIDLFSRGLSIGTDLVGIDIQILCLHIFYSPSGSGRNLWIKMGDKEIHYKKF